MTDRVRHTHCVWRNSSIPVWSFAGVVVFSFLSLLSGMALGGALAISRNSGPGGFVLTATTSGFASGLPDAQKPNTGFYVDGGFQKACPGPAGTDAYANCSVQLTISGSAGLHTIEARNSIPESDSNTTWKVSRETKRNW